MAITEDANGKFTGGQYWWEEADWSDIKEITSKYFEDLRKHKWLVLNPNAGAYTPTNKEIDTTADLPDYDFQTTIDNYAANVAADSTYPSTLAVEFGREIIWKGYTWICAFPDFSTGDEYIPEGKYGLNHLHMESTIEQWELHKPPDNINPSKGVWVTHNTWWRLKADRNRYHESDKYSPTYEALMDTIGSDTYLQLNHIKENLPEQLDSRLTHDGVGSNSDKGTGKNTIVFEQSSEEHITRVYDPKKEILRRYLTQIENLGTTGVPNRLNQNGDGHSINAYGIGAPQFDGNFPDGDPLDPVLNSSNPDSQIFFDKKVCAAYQNTLIRLLENNKHSIFLPTDNTYRRNKVEYDQWYKINNTPVFDEVSPYDHYRGTKPPHDPSEVVYNGHVYRCTYDVDYYYYPNGVWDPDEWELIDIEWVEGLHEGHDKYAPIGNWEWGCNESGFECILKYVGSFDWWFDTEFPYYPPDIAYEEDFNMYPQDAHGNQHLEQTGPNVYCDDYIDVEYDTAYPKPIGTWRRTFKYSFGRVDQRETHDYRPDEDPPGSTSTHALTKTLMRPGELSLEDSACEWIPLQPLVYHWFGDHDPPVPLVPVPRDATFGYWTYPRPWPSEWSDSTKLKRWYGFSWGDLLVRPTHLPYFDSNGETYDQYDPEPTCDGRPDFKYEELKETYDADPDSLSEDETELVEAYIEMNARHDPAQITNDSSDGDYEIQSAMLTEMREILMACRLREHTHTGVTAIDTYGATTDDGKLLSTFKSVASASTMHQAQVDTMNACAAWIDDDPDNWTELFYKQGVGFFVSVYKWQENPWVNSTNFINNDWVFVVGSVIHHSAFKLEEVDLLNQQTVVQTWCYATLTPDRSLEFVACELEIGASDRTIKIPANQWDPIKMLVPVQINSSGWYKFEVILPVDDSPFVEDDFMGCGMCELSITTSMMVKLDWEELDSFIFDTPNIKGLKQIE